MNVVCRGGSVAGGGSGDGVGNDYVDEMSVVGCLLM